jgi:aspartate kinase
MIPQKGLAVEQKPKTNIQYVAKFGGSSLANADRIISVYKLIKEQYIDQGKSVALVMSAMGKSTNNLLASGQKALKDGVVDIAYVENLVNETIEKLEINEIKPEIEEILKKLTSLLTGVIMLRELSPRSNDYLVSFGERISTRIFAAYCSKMGTPAIQYDSFDIGFITNDNFMNAEIESETYKLVKSKLSVVPQGTVAVITGFLGKAKESGAITTLGRGGSDLTASVIGAAMNTEEIHVWKDVDGVLTADPFIVKHAKPVPVVTFREANELAFFGADILHPLSMRPAWEHNIPVRVRNSYNPSAIGTLVQQDRKNNLPVTSLVEKDKVTLVDIISMRMVKTSGFMSQVFKIFKDNEISVDVVATSEVSISLTLDPAQFSEKKKDSLKKAEEQLNEFAYVTVREDMSIVSIIGNTQHSAELIGRAGLRLSQGGVQIEMASIGASKVNLSLVVTEENAKLAIKLLHDEFFPSI